MMSKENSELEKYYETVVLPQYGFAPEGIVWKSHGRIGEDVFANYFTSGGNSYVLVFEDFPSEAHYVAADDEFIPAPGYQDGRIYIAASTPDDYIEGVTGYFSLYKEG